MRLASPFVAVLLLTSLAFAAPEPEPRVVESRIERVSLFKNGLCVVHRVVELPEVGDYMLAEVPTPVHGTYFVTSNVLVRSRVIERRVRVPAEEAGPLSPQGDLAGREVTIVLRGAPEVPVQGRIVAMVDDGRTWSRTYEQGRTNWWSQPRYANRSAEPRGHDFLVLDTDDGGRAWVDPMEVLMLRTADRPAEVEQVRPTLVLIAEADADGGDAPLTVRISYLSKGLAWAPAYRVDLTDAGTLDLLQSAVVRNEMEDLDGVEVELVSGFPSMVFSHVLSPLAPDATWAGFFTQLNQRFEDGHAVLSNVARQMAGPYEERSAVDAAVTLVGERADLHYQPIGRITLAAGEAMHLNTASGATEYERIVEWTIPDTRDEFGRRYEEYRRQQNPELFDDSAWDAVRFANPLQIPMTTAPATIIAADRFLGQQMATWVNPDELTTLRITKALSIITRHTEQESVAEDRDYVYIGGHRYREVAVEGRLEITNRRGQPTTMVIKRRFSGELREAEGDPMIALLETGVYSDNPRNELTWEVALEPKQSRTLTYRYEVFVRQ